MQLTRRGEAVAVLVGHQKFEQLAASRRSFAEAYREFKTTVDLAELSLNPDEIFVGVRDTVPDAKSGFEPCITCLTLTWRGSDPVRLNADSAVAAARGDRAPYVACRTRLSRVQVLNLKDAAGCRYLAKADGQSPHRSFAPRAVIRKAFED